MSTVVAQLINGNWEEKVIGEKEKHKIYFFRTKEPTGIMYMSAIIIITFSIEVATAEDAGMSSIPG